MKVRLLFLICLTVAFSIYNSEIRAKVLHEDPDEIEWDEQKNGRSIFPLRGYVEDGVVTLYLYDNPDSVAITITDAAATPIYKEVVTDVSVVNIDLGERKGEFVITVEYNSKVFSGTFSLD